MVLKTIYKQPEYRIYRAHSCSFARFFTLFMKIVCIIVPFILAYRTEGLWKLTDIHTEKPNIQFSYSMLAYIYLKNDRYVTWSTFDNFNHIEMPNLRIPVVTSYEEDTNFDDKNDILYLNLSFPLNENEQVVGVQIYLVFDYVLEVYNTFKTKALGIIETRTSDISALSLYYRANSVWTQLKPLPAYESLNIQNDVINDKPPYDSNFKLRKIQDDYIQRPYQPKLNKLIEDWQYGRIGNYTFNTEIIIDYTEQTYKHYANIWNILKWALVQYLAVAVPLWYFIDKIVAFIFNNRLMCVHELSTVGIKQD